MGARVCDVHIGSGGTRRACIQTRPTNPTPPSPNQTPQRRQRPRAREPPRRAPVGGDGLHQALLGRLAHPPPALPPRLPHLPRRGACAWRLILCVVEECGDVLVLSASMCVCTHVYTRPSDPRQPQTYLPRSYHPKNKNKNKKNTNDTRRGVHDNSSGRSSSSRSS